jgi:hypothetical protein
VLPNAFAGDQVIPVPPVRAVLAFDGNEKSFHYANAGRAQADIEPSCNRYFGSANTIVLEQLRDGTLSNLGKNQRASEDDNIACSSEFRCSRVAAAPRGETDRCGILGGACGHTFPAKDMFLDMVAPENHTFYDLVFAQVGWWR